MDKPLINKVAQSGLLTIKLEAFFPDQAVEVFDLKDYLYMELILKEKDFRTALKAHDWEQYLDKIVLLTCSADAIIPMWAYMLVTSYAEPYAADVFVGNEATYNEMHFRQQLAKLDISAYADQRLVIKGCADKPIPPSAYVEFTKLVRPVAKSIFFGEPCSTVPIYKKPQLSKTHQKK